MTYEFDTRAEHWIPHRGAMRLIDRVVEIDDARSIAEVEVPIDGPFMRNGVMPAWIGIEYMAQAVSAWSGARARKSGGVPRIGMLLGCRRYDMHRHSFEAGTRLRVEIQCDFMGDNGMGVFDCRIEVEGVAVATGRLSVYEPPQDASPLALGGLP